MLLDSMKPQKTPIKKDEVKIEKRKKKKESRTLIEPKPDKVYQLDNAEEVKESLQKDSLSSSSKIISQKELAFLINHENQEDAEQERINIKQEKINAVEDEYISGILNIYSTRKTIKYNCNIYYLNNLPLVHELANYGKLFKEYFLICMDYQIKLVKNKK